MRNFGELPKTHLERETIIDFFSPIAKYLGEIQHAVDLGIG